MRPRRGASAVEFALTLPILLTLLSAIVDYSWFLSRATHVTQAVREGARFGAVFSEADGAATEASAQTSAVLIGMGFDCGGAITCDVTSTVTTSTSAIDLLTVNAVIPYRPPVGLVPVPEQIRGTLTMALEE